MKAQAQERATFDYILADLIGRSIGRIYSSTTNIPDIATVYPTLFDSKDIEEKKAEKLAEISALRFKQYASFHNNRFNGGGKSK